MATTSNDTIQDLIASNKAAASGETIAFAFDIDGVFHRSGIPLPHGPEMIQLLQVNNIPFVFLTNGGGATEDGQAAKLSQTLGGINIEGRNFIQSHTPWLDLVPRFQDEYVLVVGGSGNDCREAALAYGFKKVITPADIKVHYDTVYPFSPMDQYRDIARPLPAEHTPDNPIRTAAVTIWSSSRDYGLDLQIIMDCLLSEGGKLGTRAANHGSVFPDNGVEVHSCNPDYTFANAYPLPRFAQGAFISALKGIVKDQHNADLVITSVGKPTQATYLYAEKVLDNYHKAIHAESGSSAPLPRIRTVYMVGDNPLSNIAGANAFQSPTGTEWQSILVETGVHIAGSVPAVTPTTIVHGVKEAVQHGFKDLNRVGKPAGNGENSNKPELDERGERKRDKVAALTSFWESKG